MNRRILTAHLQHIRQPVSIGRIYEPDQSFDNRDPFAHSFVVRWIGRQTVEIQALDKPLTVAAVHAIKQALIAHGIERVKIERPGGRNLTRRYPAQTPTLPPHPDVQP